VYIVGKGIGYSALLHDFKRDVSRLSTPILFSGIVAGNGESIIIPMNFELSENYRNIIVLCQKNTREKNAKFRAKNHRVAKKFGGKLIC